MQGTSKLGGNQKDSFDPIGAPEITLIENAYSQGSEKDSEPPVEITNELSSVIARAENYVHKNTGIKALDSEDSQFVGKTMMQVQNQSKQIREMFDSETSESIEWNDQSQESVF